MFNYNGFQQSPYGGGNSFTQTQPQTFLPSRMDYMQSMQSMQPQQSGIQARPVTGREEAVAATVFPGSPMLFLDRAHGMVYYKAIDPQTGAAEFVDFTVAQPAPPPAPPQYVTVEMFDQWRSEFESRFTAPAQRRAKGADSE